MTDLEAVKEGTRGMWSRGDYGRLAARIESAAREVVDGCAISAGQVVLDVAAGNGNAAVLAAREGAAVTASDLTPAMVELGRARTEGEGLDVEWTVADAEELPFEDERFDCATSVFGAMFAPRPDVVARELFRVVRPGNTVGMANWTPEGFNGRFFALGNRYAPPPPEDVPRPTDWGCEEIVRERFADLAGSILVEPRFVRWSFADAGEASRFFEETAGPSATLAEMLDDESRGRLREEFAELVDQFNSATDGSVEVDAEYLLVVARRRG
ncbi:MAG: Methyltransferase type 11 [uncultured Solirubrobacterales bacterium]|uniref:Methyltransferase type 11 n=1 Tax=uncultured Solirubrobacterales bacterium TaxID=768556 RepID=A0A6J4TB21_9ACTN|nr:MAG: Methyltransferase type 11 [uncultured Solirubrobacterales bacterium]